MKKVQGNDSFQRINYLYQISKVISETNPVLSAYYGNLIISIAKKNVLKLHPDIKRQICKKCRCVMVNGVTMKTKIGRNNRNKSKCIRHTCTVCGHQRIMPVNAHNKIWIQNEEAVVEVIS